MPELSRKERERLRRKNYIIDAAEKIFARDGYENASMNEIAKEAEFSKRTLYQYFENKSDLYLTVALRFYDSMINHIQELNLTQTTGYEKIREVFAAYYDFYKQNESGFRIMYDIGQVRQETDNKKVKEFLKKNHFIFKKIQDLIILGQEDGSISTELDPVLTTNSLIFLLTGFFNQLTIAGNSFTRHINVNKDNFSTYVLDLIHLCLKNTT